MCSGQYTDPETGLQYLRARYYDPATGQMLSRDPAVSSTRDAYGYAARSPLNGSDPSGLDFYGIPTSVDEAKDAAGTGADYFVQGATTVMNMADGSTQAGLVYGEITSGGGCYVRDWIYVECDGAASPASGTPFTIGNVVENPDNQKLNSQVWNHETNHSTQWGALGPFFLPAYLIDRAIEGRCNSFEHEAGYTDGGYNSGPNPCQPQGSAAAACNSGGYGVKPN